MLNGKWSKLSKRKLRGAKHHWLDLSNYHMVTGQKPATPQKIQIIPVNYTTLGWHLSANRHQTSETKRKIDPPSPPPCLWGVLLGFDLMWPVSLVFLGGEWKSGSGNLPGPSGFCWFLFGSGSNGYRVPKKNLVVKGKIDPAVFSFWGGIFLTPIAISSSPCPTKNCFGVGVCDVSGLSLGRPTHRREQKKHQRTIPVS